MSTLSIDDLNAIKTIVVVAMNRERREAEARAGADFLQALRIDGERAQPQLGENARRAVDRTRELGELHDRIGGVLDEACVEADPDCKVFRAAHARVRDRARSNQTHVAEGEPRP